MENMIESFGWNAGKVWEQLNTAGPLNEDELRNRTGLNNDEFYGVLGWLARENKITRCDESTYCLGEWDVNYNIGDNAGKVWKVLDIWGDMDLASICRLTHLNETDAYAALGWLAREGKIEGNTLSQYTTKKVFWLK